MAETQGNWIKLEEKGAGPGARSSHAITIVGSKVYAFGGEFTPRVPVDNKLYVFDLIDQEWSVADAKGDIPPPRVGVTMATIGETIYVFGGRDAEHKELNELYSFDTSSNKWSLLSGGDNGPPHRSYHSMTSDDRRIYVFGGCGNSGRLSDLWGYDVVDKKWIKFPAPEENCKPRGGPGLTVVLGKIWVIYGFSGIELDDVHYFDAIEEKWVQVETNGEKPTARSVFSTFAIGDSYLKPYVIADPEVIVSKRMDTDEFLILASDRLWDVIPNDVACDITRRCLNGQMKKMPPCKSYNPNDSCSEVMTQGNLAAQATPFLAELSIARGSKDNISVIVAELNLTSFSWSVTLCI